MTTKWAEWLMQALVLYVLKCFNLWACRGGVGAFGERMQAGMPTEPLYFTFRHICIAKPFATARVQLHF